MFNRVLSAAIVGIDVIPVQVEVDVSDGLPQFTMVGSLTGQVREAEDRVRTSLRNIGIALPPKKITVNLAPADVLKNGSGFDLPIALGILAGEQKIPADSLTGLSEFRTKPEGALLVAMKYGGNLDTSVRLIELMLERYGR